MQIKLKVAYNRQHPAGSNGEGLSSGLKRRLVKVGLAEVVKPTPKAKPRAKPKAKAKILPESRTAPVVMETKGTDLV